MSHAVRADHLGSAHVAHANEQPVNAMEQLDRAVGEVAAWVIELAEDKGAKSAQALDAVLKEVSVQFAGRIAMRLTILQVPRIADRQNHHERESYQGR